MNAIKIEKAKNLIRKFRVCHAHRVIELSREAFPRRRSKKLSCLERVYLQNKDLLGEISPSYRKTTKMIVTGTFAKIHRFLRNYELTARDFACMLVSTLLPSYVGQEQNITCVRYAFSTLTLKYFLFSWSKITACFFQIFEDFDHLHQPAGQDPFQLTAKIDFCLSSHPSKDVGVPTVAFCAASYQWE